MNTKSGAVSSVICPNCDTALPGGCGGVFKDSDGDSCWLNRPDKVEAAQSGAGSYVKRALRWAGRRNWWAFCFNGWLVRRGVKL